MHDRLAVNGPVTAMLTGWVRSRHINRLLSAFWFSELTVLFFPFEERYLRSLQKHNQRRAMCLQSANGTESSGAGEATPKSANFAALYTDYMTAGEESGNDADIIRIEKELDKTQYTRYSTTGAPAESTKAKRIDFDNDYFIYAADSHKFLVINELIGSWKKDAIVTRKVDDIFPGDVIALINTDRDILLQEVERQTDREKLAAIQEWTQLWKKLLRDYYTSTGNDFKKLVKGLRDCHCTRHESTIRSWLLDEARIGPGDDADLISIALLTGSELLHEKISTVREAISEMIGLRMKAADNINERIRQLLHLHADHTTIGARIPVKDLGTVHILKVAEIQPDWELIDTHYVNKTLQKEML
jgi:hypothetical protein